MEGAKVMRFIRISLFLLAFVAFFGPSAFATTSSQILVMSSQLYQIARDLTTGLFPTSILLIAIGIWGFVNAFGKSIGDGIHQLTNIIAVGGIVFFASSLLVNAALFSAQM
jgi:predicted permease